MQKTCTGSVFPHFLPEGGSLMHTNVERVMLADRIDCVACGADVKKKIISIKTFWKSYHAIKSQE